MRYKAMKNVIKRELTSCNSNLFYLKKYKKWFSSDLIIASFFYLCGIHAADIWAENDLKYHLAIFLPR